LNAHRVPKLRHARDAMTISSENRRPVAANDNVSRTMPCLELTTKYQTFIKPYTILQKMLTVSTTSRAGILLSTGIVKNASLLQYDKLTIK
jgi:hypothetical protein